jgi:hypothetical protein
MSLKNFFILIKKDPAMQSPRQSKKIENDCENS